MWKKVVAPTALVSLLWIVFSSATTFYINSLLESHRRLLSENVAAIRAAGVMRSLVWRMQAVTLHAEESSQAEAREEVLELDSRFGALLASTDEIPLAPSERLLAADIRDKYAIFRKHINRRLEPFSPGSGHQPVDVTETMALARAVSEPCRQLVELNEQLLEEMAGKNGRLSESIILMRVVFLIIGPGIGLLLGFWVARGLHRSITQISVTLQDAAGEMKHEVGQVELFATGDLPGLQHQVEVVAARIRHVVEDLQTARQLAMKSERLAAVGELAAGIAHEIRNPLTSVKLLIQTAAQRNPDRALNDKQLQVVQEEIARMENTIQGLLDFAKPPHLYRRRHDIRDTLRRALNLVMGRALHQGVIVAEDLPDEPVLVEGDPQQLHQVFVNLLLNGIESMEAGGELQVRLELGDAAENVCRVSVLDSGMGIPEPILQRLFEPFVTSKERGTGLGLAISRRIILKHGGNLTAANRPLRGAMFTVELPLDAGEPSSADSNYEIILAEAALAATAPSSPLKNS